MLLTLLSCLAPTPLGYADPPSPSALALDVAMPEAQSSFALPLAIYVQLPPTQRGCQMMQRDGAEAMQAQAQDGSLQYRVVQVTPEQSLVHTAKGMQAVPTQDGAALKAHVQSLESEQRQTVALCAGDVISVWNRVLVFVDPAVSAEQLWGVLDAVASAGARADLAVSLGPSQSLSLGHMLGDEAAYVSVDPDGLLIGSRPETQQRATGVEALPPSTACARLDARGEASAGEVVQTMASLQALNKPVFLGEAPPPGTQRAPSATAPLLLDLDDEIAVLQVSHVGEPGWRGGACGQGDPSIPPMGGLLGAVGAQMEQERAGRVDATLALQDAQGAIDLPTARRSIGARSGGAEQCMQQALERNPTGDPRGGVTFRIQVDADGVYQGLETQEDRFEDPLVAGCIASWLGEQPVPAPGQPGAFTLIFEVSAVVPPQTPGQAEGLGGLGTKGTGSSPYGSGSGTFGAKGEGGLAMLGEPIIYGALDRALIDAVVKRHASKIRYCYQRQLVKDPELAGKLVVKFVIEGDGSVSSATTKASTLDDASVEGCVNGRFMRMVFPEPKGGGTVVVSYPFVFSPS